MLMMIGAVPLEVWPLNPLSVDHNDAASFAEKAVIGRRPILEAVGEGEGTIKVSAKLFPQKLGGESYVAMLDAQRKAQQSLPVLRGDGTPLGWHVITDLSVKHERLDPQGVGRIVAVEISLKRSDPPGPGGLFGLLSGLFS